MDTLVSSRWLNAHLHDDDLVVLDCSVKTVMQDGGGFHNESGRDDYLQGHIPGAGFADLKSELCGPEPEFALLEPKAFCEVMGSLGVGDDSRVVPLRRLAGFLGSSRVVDAALDRL